MSGKTNLDIDGVALRKQLQEHGIRLTEASKEMGMGDNYLNLCIQRNNISPVIAKLIEHMYGVPLHKYQASSVPSAADMSPVVEAIRQLQVTAKESSENLDDIRYAINILAKDLKIIKHELVPEEENTEEGEDA